MPISARLEAHPGPRTQLISNWATSPTAIASSRLLTTSAICFHWSDSALSERLDSKRPSGPLSGT